MPNKTAGSRVIRYQETVFYPAYVGITFNRKTTKFPYSNDSLTSFGQWYVEDKAERFILVVKEEVILEASKKEMDDRLNDFKTKLSKVIEYEYTTLGDRHTIVGINRRMIQYDKEFKPLMLYEIYQEFIEVLKSKLSYLHFLDVLAWGSERTRRDRRLSSTDPIGLMIYLTEEVKLIEIADIPISVKEKFYSFAVFSAFQLSAQKTFTLFDWLANPNNQSDLLSFTANRNSISLPVEIDKLQVGFINPSTVLKHLQDFGVRAIDRASVFS
ncbi:MAG: hypothetical protein HUU01_12180 [Saprospiraceae bacterium]|nr:hypothetical protein [Saprospiraceae bacterium]